MKKKLIRTATVAMSLDLLLKGQLAFFNNYFDVVAVSGNDNHLENVRNREKVKTIDVAFQRKISPIKDFISLIKLYQVLIKEKPEIVHSITPKAGLLSMIAGYFARVPIRIHTFTGLIFPSKTGVLKILLINLDRLLCFFATNIIAEGNGVKNDLIANKITHKPIFIIANGNVNGIDIDYFDPNLFLEIDNNSLKSKLNILPTDFVFIFVGRLVSDKGINELITAFEKLSAINHDVKLLLVGDFEEKLDPLLPETSNIISSNKNIISVGFQDDVRPYFAIASILVLPSYREGFPNVVLQAGAMGLPSIVTNINGCNEIITHNYNGIIIETKNYNAVFIAMQNVCTDSKLVQNLALKSRQNIIEKFDQNSVWNALMAEYRKFEKS